MRDYIPALAWETLRIPQSELVDVVTGQGKGSLGPLLKLLPLDGWMDGWMEQGRK